MSKLSRILKALDDANKHLAYSRQLQANSAERLATIAHHAVKVGTFIDRSYPVPEQPVDATTR